MVTEELDELVAEEAKERANGNVSEGEGGLP